MTVLNLLATWAPETFPQWFGVSAAFGALGIVCLLVGVLIFDKIYHIDFNKEISKGTNENGNIAAALVLAALILGIAFIIGKAIGQ